MTIEADLRAAVSRADADSRLLHDIVHGDATETVTTEGGTVKTVAKAIDDVEASVAAAASTVTDGVADAEAARDAAAAARDAAQAAVGSVACLDGRHHARRKLSVKLEAGRGLEAVIDDAGADERLALALTPQVNAGALIALAEAFI